MDPCSTCQICFALVIDDFYYEHQQWHEDNHPTGKDE